jgi:hypothetical protein
MRAPPDVVWLAVTMSHSSIANAPLRFLRAEVAVLGVAGGIAVAISILLVGADWLDHAPPSLAHFAALIVSGLVAGAAGLLGRTSAPWFGWLAYGITMASALLALRLIAAIALTRELPDDPNAWGLLVLSLLSFACTLRALLLGRS